MPNNTIATKHCPYCMSDERVINYSVKTFEGYRNPLTGKDNAFVEYLACGHRYVDNRFDVDSVYFHTPDIKIPEPKASTPVQYIPYKRSRNKGGMNCMDVCVLGCMAVLAAAFFPLVIFPVMYFYNRLK